MPDNWYVQSGGQQLGPMPLESVQRMKAEGKLQPADFVWAEGWGQWQPAGEVAELGGGAAGTGIGGAGVPAEFQGAGAPAAPLPYQAAQPRSAHAAGLEYRGAPNSAVVASPGALQALVRTRPWIMLWAVCLYLGAALFIGGALVFLVGMLFIDDGPLDEEPFFLIVPLLYLLGGAVYLFAALYLTRFFVAIGATRRLGRAEDLERAMIAQLRFWRLTGIALLTFIVLYFVVVALFIAFGLF